MLPDLDALALLTPDLAARLAADFAAWTARPRPLGVVIGDYNAGKTSLLKRLCAELGGALPPGARVAADPATYRAQTVPFLTFDLVDTPGLSGGDDAHDARAAEAAFTADFLVVAVLPSLFTGATGVYERLLSGAAWGAPPPPAVVLLTRADGVGVSPVDDADGWRAVCDTKVRELAARLAEWGVRDVPILPVSADPFGMVENLEDATLEDYAAQPWDGVAAVIAQLTTVAAAASREVGFRRHTARLVAERVVRLRAEEAELLASAAAVAAEDPTAAHARIGAIVGREHERLRGLVHGAAEGLAVRVRAGEGVGERELGQLFESLEDALASWQSAASARLAGELDDEEANFVARAPGTTAWSGAAGDAPLHRWERFAPQLAAVMERAGKAMSAKPDAVRERVDQVYDWMDWKAKPWEKVKKTKSTVATGKNVLEGARHAAAALGLVDEVRQWIGERSNVAARQRAEAGLRLAVDVAADAVFLGTEDEPGLGTWWQRYDAAVRGRHRDACAALRAEAARIGALAVALEEWGRG